VAPTIQTPIAYWRIAGHDIIRVANVKFRATVEARQCQPEGARRKWRGCGGWQGRRCRRLLAKRESQTCFLRADEPSVAATCGWKAGSRRKCFGETARTQKQILMGLADGPSSAASDSSRWPRIEAATKVAILANVSHSRLDSADARSAPLSYFLLSRGGARTGIATNAMPRSCMIPRPSR